MNVKLQALAKQAKQIAIDNGISYDEALRTITAHHVNNTEKHQGKVMRGVNQLVALINESPIISSFLNPSKEDRPDAIVFSPDAERPLLVCLEGKFVFVYPRDEVIEKFRSSFEERKYAVALVTEHDPIDATKPISATLFLPDGAIVSLRDVQSGLPTGKQTVYAYSNRLRLFAPTT